MTDETAVTQQTPQTPITAEVEGLPLLLGLGTYQPTVKQAQAVYLFLHAEVSKPIHRIVGEITYDASLWYKWKKTPGFLEWFEKICHTTFSREKLLDVHAAIYRRALGNSPADSKLFLQRFDPHYTERSSQDNTHNFAGYNPAGASRSEERQRKALAKQVRSLPVVAGDAREAEDIPLLEANTGDCASACPLPHTCDAEASKGVGHVYAGLARALQAQSQVDAQHTEHEQPASNDETLDSKPITPVDPPPGGLSG